MGVSSPKLRAKVEPVYSDQARHAKLEGTVTLKMVVGANGSVREIYVIDPLGLGLDDKPSKR